MESLMNKPIQTSGSAGAIRPGAHRQGRWANRGVWASGLLVAVGAAVATAHGLYAVVLATGTLPVIAALYPLITDGLALVAYAATARLTGSGRRYAWAIVVLAAGLSGLAQATHVAGGLDHAAVPDWLRFGVGAWPALAAAIVAHLLYLLGHARNSRSTTTESNAGAASNAANASNSAAASTAAAEADGPSPEHVQPSTSILPSSGAVHLPQLDAPAAEQIPGQTSIPVTDRPAAARPKPARPQLSPGQDSASRNGTPRDRARAAALRHQERTGDLPTVSTLMELADVARGTAGNALRDIRDEAGDQPRRDHHGLHVVNGVTDGNPTRKASSDRSGQQ